MDTMSILGFARLLEELIGELPFRQMIIIYPIYGRLSRLGKVFYAFLEINKGDELYVFFFERGYKSKKRNMDSFV